MESLEQLTDSLEEIRLKIDERKESLSIEEIELDITSEKIHELEGEIFDLEMERDEIQLKLST